MASEYFSDKGTVYSARAYKVPECSRTAAGTPLVHVSLCPFSFSTHSDTYQINGNRNNKNELSSLHMCMCVYIYIYIYVYIYLLKELVTK